MAIQLSVAVRDARADSWEATVGTAPKLQIRSGAQPANCAAADSGTLLCEMDLPSDYLTASSSGVKSKSGTWSGVGVAAGTAGHFRIKNTAGSICHMQGSVGTSGTDMIIDNASIAVDQSVTVTAFSTTEPNA